MKNLLPLVILFLSSIAFADTTLELTGLTLKKSQIVKVEVDARERHIQMIRVDSDYVAEDVLEITLNDIEPGVHTVHITVFKNNAGKQKKGEFAIGKIAETTTTKVNVE